MGRLSRCALRVRARSQSRLLAHALRQSAAESAAVRHRCSSSNSSPVIGRKQRAFFPRLLRHALLQLPFSPMDCTHSNVAVEMARRLMPVAEADNFALGAIHGRSL